MNFGFLSYSHADITWVEYCYKLLERNGINAWYDDLGRNIPPGERWREVVDKRIKDCGVFLCFLSNGIDQRSEVWRELKLAMSDEKKLIVFVLLERIVLNALDVDEEFKRKIRSSQTIAFYRYGGTTEAQANQILSKDIWSDQFVDEDYRAKHGLKPWQKVKNVALDCRIEDIGDGNAYVYDRADPREVELDGIRVHRVKGDELDPNACFPVCFDNQWGQGDADRLREKILIQALMHNFQVVVNRAALVNSTVFRKCFKTKGSAFASLMNNGSIVAFLFNEKSPLFNTAYGVDAEAKANFDRFVRENSIYCLSYDWERERNRKLLGTEYLSQRFHNSMLDFVESEIRLEAAEKVFGLTAAEGEKFRARWREIQADILRRSESEGKLYSREEFYKRWVVKDNTKVEESKIDDDKPFAREVKQVADLVYITNLPRSLGIEPLFAKGDTLEKLRVIDDATRIGGREISVAEIVWALKQFKPEAVKRKSWSYGKAISLDEVASMRKLGEWSRYVNTILSAHKRATENMLDFYDVERTYEYYNHCFATARTNELLENKYAWKKCTRPITLIVEIDDVTIKIRYDSSGRRILRPRICEKRSAFIGKSIVAVSYTFADGVRRLLFRGACDGGASELVSAIADLSKEDRVKKKNSMTCEWMRYLALRRQRPELFVDGKLEIVTDERAVDEFSSRSGLTIGVKHESAWSRLVVDLVKNEDGEMFAYERIIPKANGAPVVTVPRTKAGKFVLLRQFRHAIRGEQLCFPRGFGEDGLSAEENAAKELAEEVGAKVEKDSIKVLGSFTPDSGLMQTNVSVVACTVEKYGNESRDEGILSVEELTEAELLSAIAAGKITDGMTIVAFSLFRNLRSQVRTPAR